MADGKLSWIPFCRADVKGFVGFCVPLTLWFGHFRLIPTLRHSALASILFQLFELVLVMELRKSAIVMSLVAVVDKSITDV